MSENLYQYNSKVGEGMGYHFSKEINTDVVVTYDESIISDKYKNDNQPNMSNEDIESTAKQKMDGETKQRTLGLQQQMDMDTRILNLELNIKNGNVYTIQSAQKLLGVSRQTIIKYLKKIGYQLLDANTGNYLGGKKFIVRDKGKIEKL